MKTKLGFAVVLLFGLITLLLSGCYTQVAGTRAERGEREEYAPQSGGDDTTAESYDSNNNCCGDWNSNYRYGFSYYYPPYDVVYPAFWLSVGYANPWAYDPWLYSSFYGYGYYPYSYYGYGFGRGYYNSYAYGYGYGYRYGMGPYGHGVRTFGSTRGDAGVRLPVSGGGAYQGANGSTSGGTLPTGARLNGSGSTSNRRTTTSTVTTPRNQNGSRRAQSIQGNAYRRGGRTALSGRPSGARGTPARPGYRSAPSGHRAPPSYSAPRGGYRGGSGSPSGRSAPSGGGSGARGGGGGGSHGSRR